MDRVLDNILDRIPYFIFWKNRELVYEGCNQRFATLIGKNSPKEIISKTDFDLGWGQGEPELFREGDLEVMEGNPKLNIEETLIRPDGSKMVMLVSKIPLRDKYDNCIGILGISNDITERKKAEEELRIAKEKAVKADETKSRFLATVSHELRTPLNAILGFADILKREDLKDVQRQYIEDIKTSGEHLLAIINDVLDSY